MEVVGKMLAHFHKRHLLMELFILAALVYFFIFFFIRWPLIEGTIPTHFNFSGQPDAWGDKSSLLVVLIISLVIYLLITAVELFPRLWNFPVALTDNNRQTLVAMSLDLLIMIKLLVVLVFALIAYWSITIQQMPVWFLPLFLVLLFGVIGLSLGRMVRYSSRLKTAQSEQ